jgi:hypothetical protein
VRLISPLAVSARDLLIYDPEYVFRLRPGARGRHYFRAESARIASVRFEISEQGLRDDVIPTKPADEYRIAILGDSFAYGACVEIEETIGRQLQGVLRSRYPAVNIRVINLGVGGTGPWQQRGLLHDLGFALQPDLVIHQLLTSNDVANQLSQNGELLDAYWVEDEDAMDRFRLKRHPRFRAETWLDEHSEAFAVASRAIGREKIFNTLRFGVRFLPPLPRTRRPFHSGRYFVMEVELEQWYPTLERGWRMLIDDVAAIATDCTERGISYAVFNAPYREEIRDDHWARFSVPTKDGHTYERGKGHRLLSEAMAERGIPFVPTFEPMRTAPDRDSYHFEYDGHFTAAGNRAIADILAEYVEDLGVLDGTVTIERHSRRTAVP